MIKKTVKNSGFTLVEMIVALAIFTVVAVIAVGALVKVTSLSRRAQSLQTSMNNTAFVLDAMSREIRVGAHYNCADGMGWSMYTLDQAKPCPIRNDNDPSTDGPRIIAFESSKTTTIGSSDGKPCRLIYAYAFAPNSARTLWKLEKAQQSQCNETISYSGSDSDDFYPVLDNSNVFLTDYRLGVFNTDPGEYSLVFVRLVGYSGIREQDKNLFDIQTAISQRVHD